MGELFHKIIPLEMLAQMPLSFVHRLRDIRIKQLQEANKIHRAEMSQKSPQLPVQGTVDPSAIEDFIDELS